MGRIATSVTMAAKSAGKSAKEAAKGATKAAEAAKEAPAVVKKRAKPGQTVSDPERMAFPGIYKRPDIIAQEAASMVAPESPSMKELFGVTRDELYDISRGLRGNLPGELPGAAAKPRGSEAAEKVMTKKNTQRLLDVLSEVERFPELMKGMDSWYTMVPLYQKAVEVLGAERAKAEYPIMNALMGMASPGSAVTTEIPRGTAAYYLQKQGRFPEFMTELGKPVGLRDPRLDPEILGVPGHPYHKTAQGLPMQRFLETGEMQMESPKVPMYIEASGVPETGFQTRTPVGDAHFVRGVGLADVRTNKGFAGSITTPEMTSIAPWWREKVAGELGIESVPAQARTWGAFAPQTGVDTPIGAPKLELIADDIMRAARRLNISPIEARDRWLRGEIRLGGDVGKAEGGSVSEPGSADYGAPADPLQYEDPQEIERYMRESAADIRLGALNEELQSKIEMYRRGLLTAKDMQEFFPGYSDFDLAGMFGMTDADLPRDPEISRRRLTPEFLANALSFEEQLKKELEEEVRKSGKKSFPPKYESNLAEGGSVGSPDVIPPIVHDLETEYQSYKSGGKVNQVKSRACEDFDRELGKMIDFHAKLGGLVKGYAKGGAVQMSNGGETPEQEPVMDEIAYMSQALSPEGETENPERASKLRSALRAGKIIAAGVPKSFVSPVVGMYGSLKSGKFGSQEGIRAGEAAMEEFMTPSEETIAELQSDPLAMEYLENVSKFAEELGTKYKLAAQPDIIGNLGAARGVGTQIRGLAREAAGKARDMAKEVPLLPVGLSIQPVGKPVAEVIKPGKIKVPASESGFYSALDKAAANLQRKQGTGEAFLSDIKKFNPSADELQDTGLADWLKSQKTVTKQDVIDYINGNKLEVTEKVRGEPIGEADFIKVGKLEQRISRGDPTLTDEELNWFEINKKKVMNSMFEDLNPEYNEFDLMIPGGKNYREIQLRVPGVKYTSAHYPQDKDMIAWLRVQDKTIDGKKTLVIEEVQSDLHQKGRDLGYRSKDIDESVVKKELADATEAANNIEVRYNNAVSDFILKSGAGELRGEANAEAVRNIEALKIQLDAARSVQKEKEKLAKQPSDAPFKESWYQLALKRAMKYAADNDFDQVALVGAEEQIKRYQLSRKVNSIQVQPEGAGKRITVQIKTKGDVDFVIDENGMVVDVSRTDFEKAVGKDLSDVVGKPMAKKLMETDRGVIAGGDLDIGGKGMIKYYNEVYPKYLEKQYSKKYGVKPQRKDHIIGEYGPDDVEERETGEVDRFKRPTFGYLVRDRDTGEEVAYESTFEKALSEANKKAPSVPMWLMDVPQNLKSDVKIGQSYKKGGAVKMRNGGPIVSAYNTIPDVTDAGALKLAAYEQELKRYA